MILQYMRKNLFVVLAAMAISYTGCKQIAYVAPPPMTGASYFPQTYGSTWTYRDSLFGLSTDTAKLQGVKIDQVSYTMDGTTTDFNGQICYDARVISQNYGAGTAYFYANRHTYALFNSSLPWGLTIQQLLGTTVSVGYSWFSAPTLNSTLNGSPVQSVNTVLEKNITRVVGGRTFTNVIHTGTNVMIDIDKNGFQNVAYVDVYLAPGVGLIEKDAHYYGLLNETETIMYYTIK